MDKQPPIKANPPRPKVATAYDTTQQQPIAALRAIPLSREVNAYTLIESEFDSIGAGSVRLTLYLWFSALGISFGLSAMLAGASVPLPWDAEQYALFHYLPWVAFIVGFGSSVLSVTEIFSKRSMVNRIKREHSLRATVRSLSPEE